MLHLSKYKEVKEWVASLPCVEEIKCSIRPLPRSEEGTLNYAAWSMLIGYCLSLLLFIHKACMRKKSSCPVARYEPGAGFVLTQEPPSLSCSGLDPNTHEIWLLQLPSDVNPALDTCSKNLS